MDFPLPKTFYNYLPICQLSGARIVGGCRMPSQKEQNKGIKISADGYALRLNGIRLDVEGSLVTMVDADDLRALMFKESLKEKSKLHDPKFFRNYYEENKDYFYYMTHTEKKMFLSLEVAREYASLVGNAFLQKYLDKVIEHEHAY